MLNFLLVSLIVGFVTAGLTIRFDRFFTILLLIFIFGFSVQHSVNIFLWVIAAGALTIILQNKEKIIALPSKKKKKIFLIIPIFTFIASWIGIYFFTKVSTNTLIITFGILAILYGLRLMFIHFKENELNFVEAHPGIKKMCGLFGPWISGFFIGFIGTSIKPLKIPFAIKLGKMNAKEVYIGNTITAFFASIFTIFWHYILEAQTLKVDFYKDLILGLALWAGIHFIYELTELIFPQKLKKPFQILIGFLLLLASIKVFMLVK